jgi:uncharacterized membrane protein YbhN (UPF0104 family)
VNETLWKGLRWAFVLAVVIGAWWSWRESGSELIDAVRQTDRAHMVAALGLVVCGVSLSGVSWWIALDSLVRRVPLRASVPSFFVAQLGKYIPGGVWSFAAQGALGTRQGFRPRVPVAATALFLAIHVASGLALAGLVGPWTTLRDWVWLGALGSGLLGLAPVVYRRLGERLALTRCSWSWRRSAASGLVMCLVWCSYGLGLVVLAPALTLSDSLTLGAAFAVAFAVGLAVPVAPAGLGAREGVLLLLIVPVVGAGPAAALTVLARLAHTLADFLLAGIAWLVMRTTGAAAVDAEGRARD